MDINGKNDTTIINQKIKKELEHHFKKIDDEVLSYLIGSPIYFSQFELHD